MSLREREREIGALRAVAAHAVAGSGSTLLLESAAGLGKSSLLDAMPPLADEFGAIVRTARCHELERDLAWNVARELLGGPEPAAAEPDAAFAGIHELAGRVAELARERPLILVVDDLHWSDSPSLRFLVYLQQRLERLPVSIVAAMRTDEPGSEELLQAFATAPRTEVRSLAALSPDGVCAIVRELGWREADAELCAAIARASGGNPFYVHELLSALRERGTSPTADALEDFAPESVARAIARRLRRHGEAAERLARAVAVLGDGTPLRHAAAIASISDDEAVTLADELARAEILTAGHRLAFVHPLVRAAVLADIPPSRRAADHGRAALLLAEAGQTELAAAQLLHAAPVGEAWATDALETVGTRAFDGGSPSSAASYFARALEEPVGDETRRRLLIALGRAEAAAGIPAAADRFAEAAAATADPVERARMQLMLAWAKHHQGRFAEAAREFEQGLAVLGDRDPELATMLQLGFFTAGSLDASYAAEAHARVERLEREFPVTLDAAGRALLAQSLTSRTFAGEPHSEIEPLAERVWDGGRALREDGPYAETVWAVVGFWIWSDGYERALDAIEAALAEARRRGSALASARGWYARGWARYWTGDLKGAITDQRAAIDVWRGGMETYLPAAVYWLVLALLEVGEAEEAQEALDLAGPLTRWEGTAFGVFLIAAGARLALAHGDPERALARNLLCGELATTRLAVTNPALLPWRSQAALAALALGDGQATRAQAEEAVRLTTRFGAARALGEAQRVAALTLPADDGITLLEHAAATMEGVGAPVELARVLIDLGAAIRRRGRRADARVALRRGLELAETHGARQLAEHACTELAATGVRVRSRDGEQPHLTASEERVARLAAEGHTNREIAAALRVSVKAVEFHLHTTYRKLGIRGRRELAAALEPHR